MEQGSETLRLALWQCVDRPASIDERLGALEAILAAAAARGARLLLAPELAMSGYSVGSAALRAAATPADGPVLTAAATLCARHGVAAALGFAERGGGGDIHNAVAVIDERGALRAVYRKQMLAPGGYEQTVFTPGRGGLTALTLGGVRVAPLICYEVEFPEPVRALARAGVELILAPTALSAAEEPVLERLVPARAIENRLFLAYCNYANHPDTPLAFAGGSRLCGPEGGVDSAPKSEAGLSFATFDRARIRAARAAIDYVRDARADAAFPVREV